MNALEITGLCKKLNGFNIEGIDLKLPKGFILGYIGQNGAGKTTTIKLITNQLKRDSGNIKVFGKEYCDDEVQYKDMIGYIGDECYFPSFFTAKDLEDTFKKFYNSFDERKFKEYLKLWEIPYTKKIKTFSKGMKVKLAFAGIFSRETKLLLLDESTSGLDPVIRSEVLELLQEYISDGERSVLFSTHITSDLDNITDFIYFIDKGKILFNGTTEEILEGHLIVSGKVESLSTEIKKKMIGYKVSQFSFKGLIKSEDRQLFEQEIGADIEKPSVSDIMIFYIKGLRGQ